MQGLTDPSANQTEAIVPANRLALQLLPLYQEADALNTFRWLHWIHLLFYAACRFQMFRQIQGAILQYDALHLYGYWKQYETLPSANTSVHLYIPK